MDLLVSLVSWTCWCKERLKRLLSHWLAVSTLSSVTRSNITMMSGPNRLSFMVVTLPEPSWKDAFSSDFCANAEYHHLLFRTAAPAIVPCTNGLPLFLPCQPGMTQFPLTVAWFISNQALHWFSQKPPGNLPDMDPFLTSPLTAPLHSCDPQLVLAIDNSRPAASILDLGSGTWENFQKLPQNEIWSCTNNWVAAPFHIWLWNYKILCKILTTDLKFLKFACVQVLFARGEFIEF